MFAQSLLVRGSVNNPWENAAPFLCLKDGEELAANENVEIVQHGARCLVTVVCPEGEDSGIYTCFAYNDSGHASCQSQLTVEEGETTENLSNWKPYQGLVVKAYLYKEGINDVSWFLCRSTGVSWERNGAGEEKEVILCLWCSWGNWKVKMNYTDIVQAPGISGKIWNERHNLAVF